MMKFAKGARSALAVSLIAMTAACGGGSSNNMQGPAEAPVANEAVAPVENRVATPGPEPETASTPDAAPKASPRPSPPRTAREPAAAPKAAPPPRPAPTRTPAPEPAPPAKETCAPEHRALGHC